MGIEWKLQNLVKAVGFIFFFTLPPYAFYWKGSTMKNMEKGIIDDYKRIQSKGKSYADIPRKEKQ